MHRQRGDDAIIFKDYGERRETRNLKCSSSSSNPATTAVTKRTLPITHVNNVIDDDDDGRRGNQLHTHGNNDPHTSYSHSHNRVQLQTMCNVIFLCSCGSGGVAWCREYLVWLLAAAAAHNAEWWQLKRTPHMKCGMQFVLTFTLSAGRRICGKGLLIYAYVLLAVSPAYVSSHHQCSFAVVGKSAWVHFGACMQTGWYISGFRHRQKSSIFYEGFVWICKKYSMHFTFFPIQTFGSTN